MVTLVSPLKFPVNEEVSASLLIKQVNIQKRDVRGSNPRPEHSLVMAKKSEHRIAPSMQNEQSLLFDGGHIPYPTTCNREDEANAVRSSRNGCCFSTGAKTTGQLHAPRTLVRQRSVVLMRGSIPFPFC